MKCIVHISQALKLGRWHFVLRITPLRSIGLMVAVEDFPNEQALTCRLSEIGLTKCLLKMTLSNLHDSTNAMWSNCEVDDEVFPAFRPEFMQPSAIQIHQEL